MNPIQSLLFTTALIFFIMVCTKYLNAKRIKPDPSGDEAWGIIANVSGGDWKKQSPEWQEAAERWRDKRFLGIK